MKGHVSIELHNHHSGFTERIEQDNMVTNALAYAMGHAVSCGANLSDLMLPVAKRGLGGLFLFDGKLEENAENVHFPMDVHLIGHAAQTVNTDDPMRGSLNSLETKRTDTGYISVWDFSTSQANGNIASLALTRNTAGEDPLAQSESDSTGENITWTIRRKFAAGDPLVNPNRIYGYQKGEDGSWEIDPKQGKVVQFIYQKYREGWASRDIAKDLMDRGVPAPGGKIWYPSTVIQLMKNEKYKGDVQMQKTITVDRKNKICKKNEGEAKSYYIKDHHVPLVSRELWEECNQITKDREAAKLENFRKNRAKPLFKLLNLIHDKDYYKSRNERSVQNYEDERREGHYYFRREFIRRRSTGEKWYAFTLEQSFMEMLYACKEDYETYGDGSDIAMDFNEKYDAARLSQAPQGEVDQMMEEYQDFLKALSELPTITKTGRPLMVNGVNAQGTLMRTVEGYIIPGAYSMVKHGKTKVTDDKIQKTPDILTFDRAFAERYFTNMDLIGDEAEYTTRFGVKLKSIRNQRTLNAFMGYRKFDEQGNASLVMEEYQVVLDKPMFRGNYSPIG